MKKLTAILLSMFLVITMFSFPINVSAVVIRWTDGLSYDAGYGFNGGSGTEGDPYIIETEEALSQLSFNVWYGISYAEKYFLLDDDLDLAGKAWLPIGNDDTRFGGSFDGNDHTISNVTLNEPAHNGNGLFGYTSDAIIKNLGVLNCNISGLGSCGALVGYADNQTSIYDCYSTGTVVAVYDESYDGYDYNGEVAGGLVGGYGNALSTIAGCYSSATVNGDRWVGGLVGYASNARIIDSYATGTVGSSDSYDAGGFIGGGESLLIEHCYATGDVTASGNVGGFAGNLYSNNTVNEIINCYARGDVTSTYEEYGWTAGSFVGEIESTEFYNCYGSGSIDFTSTTGESYHIGGFVGTIAEGNDPSSFLACFYDFTKTGLLALGSGDISGGSMDQEGITGRTTANMMGLDTLTLAAKMDTLDSGNGSPVESGPPIWYAHAADYPDFKPDTTNYVSLIVASSKTLTLVGTGGTWEYDNTFLQLTDNGNGTASIKGLKVGSTLVTYTSPGRVENFVVTITSVNPITGESTNWIFFLIGLCAASLAAVICLKKRFLMTGK